MNFRISACAAFVGAALLTACHDDDNNTPQLDTQPTKAETPAPASTGAVKNVIMMIGDGMGPGQIGLLEEYATRAPNSIYQGNATALSTFAKEGKVGFSANGPAGSLVVDSACSASQLATGVASGSEMIGLDAQGNPVETILEKAKALGKATGLVSDTRLTHATPASFAAHQPHRSLENDIAVEMMEEEVDVMLSGGIRAWLPQEVNTEDEDYAELKALINEDSIKVASKRKDSRNLLIEARDDHNYSLAFNLAQMSEVKEGKLLGLFAYSGMANGIDYSSTKTSDTRVQPSLKEMTIKALDILSQDPDGFFLMVEGGQIDWAGHNNDAATMLHELLKFDEAIAAVHDWVKDRNDTLVVITADHETGSFGFSYGRHDLPEATTLPGSAFADRPYQPNFNFGALSILDELYAQKKDFAGILAEAAENGVDGSPTAASVQTAIEVNTGHQISIEDAAAILEMETNHYYVADHSYLDADQFPKVDDFEEFYVYGSEIHLDLIGRKLGKHQNVVWGTGTHTHTPVQVIAWGPEAVTAEYSKMLHHVEVGKLTIKALTGE